MARELAGAEGGLDVLGRAEGRRAGFHVDIRSETAVDDRRARPRHLRERQARERFGVRQCQRAGDRDRSHRARQGEGRDDQHLAGGGRVHDAIGHRDVQLEWRIGIDDGVAAGTVPELLGGEAMGDADQLEIVGNLTVTAGKHERDLVRQQQLRAHHLQMAQVHGHVLRLDRPTQHLDHIEVLAQLHEVAEVLERTGAASAGGVHDVGRPGSRREGDMPAAHGHAARRVRCMHEKMAWRGGQRLRDQGPRNPHQLSGLVDLGATIAIAAPCVGREHLHAVGLQDQQCGLVQRADLIVGKHPQRLEGILEVTVSGGARRSRRSTLGGGTAAASRASGGARFKVGHARAAPEVGWWAGAKRSMSQERNRAMAGSPNASESVTR